MPHPQLSLQFFHSLQLIPPNDLHQLSCHLYYPYPIRAMKPVVCFFLHNII